MKIPIAIILAPAASGKKDAVRLPGALELRFLLARKSKASTTTVMTDHGINAPHRGAFVQCEEEFGPYWRYHFALANDEYPLTQPMIVAKRAILSLTLCSLLHDQKVPLLLVTGDIDVFYGVRLLASSASNAERFCVLSNVVLPDYPVHHHLMQRKRAKPLPSSMPEGRPLLLTDSELGQLRLRYQTIARDVATGVYPTWAAAFRNIISQFSPEALEEAFV